MTYSYTQISQYLTCPRRYRHRYLDGWKEKDTRAAMLFGRAFERALGALFRREDPGAVLFAEWSASIAGPGEVPYHCATPPNSVPSTVGAHAATRNASATMKALINPAPIAFAPKRHVASHPLRQHVPSSLSAVRTMLAIPLD